MLKDFPTFVPSKVCLGCDGCCRFKETTSTWRPMVTQHEIKQAIGDKTKLVDKIFSKDNVDEHGYVKAVQREGICHCTFFNSSDNTCRIYAHRPFECRLYPFLLMNKDRNIVIGVHLNCPYVQKQYDTNEYFQYVETLKGYFQKQDVLNFIKENRRLARDYSDYKEEIKDVFTLNIR